MRISIIPSSLKSELDNFIKRYDYDKNDIYPFFAYLLNRATRNDGSGLAFYVPIYCRTLGDLLGNNYVQIVANLIHDKILHRKAYKPPERSESGEITKRGEMRKFALNIDYIDHVFDVVEMEIKRKAVNRHFKTIGAINIKTVDNLCKTKINVLEAKKILSDYVNSDDVLKSKHFKFDDDIVTNYFKEITIFDKSDKPRIIKDITRQQLFERFGNNDRILIKKKKNFYFISFSRFKHLRKIDVLYSYTYSILAYKHKQFFSVRDDKGRLHSSISSMPSILLKTITYKNYNFYEIDLKNAQFNLLAYAIRNKKRLNNKISTFARSLDVEYTEKGQRFLSLAESGHLYDYTAYYLETSRDDVKQYFFEMLFGSKTMQFNNDSKAKKFYSLFEPIFLLLDKFKKEFGYKALSHELQRLESSIFIDLIYKNLLKKKYFTFTKHDCILIPEPQLADAQKEIENLLNKKLGVNKYSLNTKAV